MGKVQNAKLKPGEHVFVKRENGEMEAVGVVDSRGEPPPQKIYHDIQIEKKSANPC